MNEHIGRDSDAPQLRKKKYSKPELTQVELRPEEAVLGGCKSANAGGPNTGGTCSVPGPCSDQGS